MASSVNVLVVEDETPIRVGLCDVLTFHGHSASQADNGIDGLRMALEGEVDLVLLDVMMPGLDGFEVCRRVRAQRPMLPILMLTAKGLEEDVLRGFDAGADDYVTKPFSVAQLMARVQSLLRRAGRTPPKRLVLGDVEIDADNLRARRGPRDVELTVRDVELLAYLHAHRERPVPRDELLREVWDFARTEGVETRCVDMHMVKLRRKLGELDASDVVETVRGVGYRCGEP